MRRNRSVPQDSTIVLILEEGFLERLDNRRPNHQLLLFKSIHQVFSITPPSVAIQLICHHFDHHHLVVTYLAFLFPCAFGRQL